MHALRIPLIAAVTVMAATLVLSTTLQSASAATNILNVSAKASTDPIVRGKMQTIAITVKDSKGKPVKDAFVTVKVTYASLKVKKGFSGMTDKNGTLWVSWTIASNSDPGNFSVDVKSTKGGYGAGTARSSFRVVAR
jgi:phosphatidate phosphatase APP1